MMMKKRKGFDFDFDDNPSFSSIKSRRILQDAELEENPRGVAVAEVIDECLPLQEEEEDLELATGSCNNWEWEQKAMVLYNPPTTTAPCVGSPSSVSLQFPIILDSELIPGIKDHLFWPGNSETPKLLEDEVIANNSTEFSKNSMAVITWVAPQIPATSLADGQAQGLPEPMETEQDVEMMDTENTSDDSGNWKASEFSQMVGGAEGLQQWPQQQHCMAPHSIQSTSTPVTW